MYYEAIKAEYAGGYRIAVTFADGTSGTVDFSKFIRKGGVFSRLKDVDFFKQFAINRDFGVLCWGNDVDLAPETLYAEAVGNRATAKVAEPRAKYGRKN